MLCGTGWCVCDRVVPPNKMSMQFVNSDQAQETINQALDKRIKKFKSWLTKKSGRKDKYDGPDILGYSSVTEMRDSQSAFDWDNWKVDLSHCCRKLLTTKARKTWDKLNKKKKSGTKQQQPEEQPLHLRPRGDLQALEQQQAQQQQQQQKGKRGEQQGQQQGRPQQYANADDLVRGMNVNEFLNVLGPLARYKDVQAYSSQSNDYHSILWPRDTKPNGGVVDMVVLFMDFLRLHCPLDSHSTHVPDFNPDFRQGWRRMGDTTAQNAQQLIVGPVEVNAYYVSVFARHQTLIKLLINERYGMTPVTANSLWFISALKVMGDPEGAIVGAPVGVWQDDLTNANAMY